MIWRCFSGYAIKLRMPKPKKAPAPKPKKPAARGRGRPPKGADALLQPIAVRMHPLQLQELERIMTERMMGSGELARCTRDMITLGIRAWHAGERV